VKLAVSFSSVGYEPHVPLCRQAQRVSCCFVVPSVLFLLSGTDQLLFATSAKSSQKR